MHANNWSAWPPLHGWIKHPMKIWTGTSVKCFCIWVCKILALEKSWRRRKTELSQWKKWRRRKTMKLHAAAFVLANYFSVCLFWHADFFSATNISCRRYSREETSYRPPKKVGLRQLLGVVKSFPNNTNLSEKSGLHLLWDGGSRLQNLFWDEGLTLDQL
jgi:hypothetical protein